MILGASKFCSMIFSSPLPIETTKNNCGVNPINVAQKKLLALTLKIQEEPEEALDASKPITLDFLTNPDK